MTPKSCTDFIVNTRFKLCGSLADWIDKSRSFRICFYLVGLMTSLIGFLLILEDTKHFIRMPQIVKVGYLISFKYSSVSLIYYGLFALISVGNLVEEVGLRIAKEAYWVAALALTYVFISMGYVKGTTDFLLSIVFIGVIDLFLSLRIFRQGFRLTAVLKFLLLQYLLHLLIGKYEYAVTGITQPWYFHLTRMSFVLVTASVVALQKSRFEAIKHFFNPVHWVNPVPFGFLGPRSGNITRSRVQGYLNLLTTTAALYLATYIAMWLFRDKVRLSGMVFDFHPWRSTWHYVYYFLGSYVAIAWPISLLRWRGHDMPDAFVVPLLANSPWDRWRRWNTYYYAWFFQFIFIPVLRFSRSPALGVFSVFFCTFLLHIGKRNYKWFFQGQMESVYQLSLRHLIFFMSHALVIYLALKFKRAFGDENDLSGWRGVCLTWALMLVIHSLYIVS